MGDAEGMVDEQSLVDEKGVVRIGSVIFAMIRPTPGRERAFNHWYERDHYYTTGTAAPGVFSAARFVAPASGIHLALYFVLPGHDDARVAFATEQVAAASAEGRMFGEREHLHTWSYTVESAVEGRDGVPPALALDHRYGALAVAMADTSGSGGPYPRESDGDREWPSLTLRPTAPIMPSEWEGEIDPESRRIVIDFHSVAPAPVRTGVRWSAAFVPVVFGTDTHVTDASRPG